MGAGVLEERVGAVGLDDGLLEVEDVDAVALTEDERLHLGVPATGLVAEMAAGLEQGADVDLGSHRYLLWFASAQASDLPRHPGACYRSPGTTARE